MFFSIVIPTYNRKEMLISSLQSISNQNYKSFEVIIIDDGSTDGTDEKIRPFLKENIHYFKTHNRGVAAARNAGISLSKGDYINFLDSDDFHYPEHLQKAFDILINNPNIEVLHLNYDIGAHDSVIKVNSLPRNLPDDIFKECSMHVNSLFVKRNLFEQIKFNENRELMFVEDWDFFIRLCIRYKVQLVNEVTSRLVDHPDRSMRNFNKEKWIKRKESLIESLKSDTLFISKHSVRLKEIEAHQTSLIALMLSIEGSRLESINFLVKAIRLNIKELFKRRTLAVLKHLF